jgi:hypothetical protein
VHGLVSFLDSWSHCHLFCAMFLSQASISVGVMMAAYIAHQRSQPFIRLYSAIEDSVAASEKELASRKQAAARDDRSSRVLALSTTSTVLSPSRPRFQVHGADAAAGFRPSATPVQSTMELSLPMANQRVTTRASSSHAPMLSRRRSSAALLLKAKARVAFVSIDYNLFESAFLISSVGAARLWCEGE